MLYLLDTNVLIDANRDYYPLNRVPEFWNWLINCGENGTVKIPVEVYEEIANGNDVLRDWAKSDHVKSALLFNEEVDVALVRQVIEEGYAPDLNEVEIEKLGRDPFLIAYALVNPFERCIVSTEVSRPRKQRANRRIPDVCRSLNIACKNTFELLRELDFSTSWR